MPAIIIGSVPIPIPGIPDRKIHFNHILILQVIDVRLFGKFTCIRVEPILDMGCRAVRHWGDWPVSFAPSSLRRPARGGRREVFFLFIYFIFSAR